MTIDRSTERERDGDTTTSKRAACRVALAGLVLALILGSCGVLDSDGTEDGVAADAPTGGSADQLCATAAEFNAQLTTAPDVVALADAKVAYLRAAQLTAPPEWLDNIEVILPAWETLVEVIEAADGDPSLIDFDKFLSDFADATANDAALESFVQSRCAAG